MIVGWWTVCGGVGGARVLVGELVWFVSCGLVC